MQFLRGEGGISNIDVAQTIKLITFDHSVHKTVINCWLLTPV
jgi:hypothetical protein